MPEFLTEVRIYQDAPTIEIACAEISAILKEAKETSLIKDYVIKNTRPTDMSAGDLRAKFEGMR